MRVMGIDPGGQTGMVMLNTATTTVTHLDTIIEDQYGKHLELVYENISTWYPDRIVIERFNIIPGVNRSAGTTELQIIGAVRLVGILRSIPVILQASETKRLGKLYKVSSVMKPANDHEQDALQHAIAWWVQNK